MVESVDRRAGAEGLPGVVRLPAGDQGVGRHAHDLSRRDRRPHSRRLGPRAALCRRQLRPWRAPEEGCIGGSRPLVKRAIRDLSPAYFAMVMATGVVSIAAHLYDMTAIADV